MYEMRDTVAQRYGVELIVYQNPECVERGINPFTHGSALHTDLWKTEGLKQALDKYGFDLAFGGARRDEEKSRAKERVFSVRSAQHRWDPKAQRPELWHVYNGRKRPGESIRAFPLSNWTELDVWHYIRRERIPVVPLYFAAERPVVERDGALIMVDDDRLPLRDGEVAAAAQGALPHPRLLPADRRGRERRRQPRRGDRRAAALHHLRAAGPGDRPRLLGLHGEEEAGRLLLMSTAGTGVDVGRYLEADDRKTLLRFITCGSVDDGKSTLIGRLLYESKLIFDDQLAALEADSRRVGTQGGALDFALLVDGLAAEREQGITIDVAYRFFTTERRKFIVADTPGHEQYTRNMATGASTADVAVILVDARKGVLTQTRRHSFIVAMLGIKHVVLAVNKMDLVGYDQAVFDRIAAEYREFAAGLGLTDVAAIPVSALRGDNVIEPGANMPWYDGPPLIGYLEAVEVAADAVKAPSACRCSWSPVPTWISAATRGSSPAGRCARATRCACCRPAPPPRSTRIVTCDGDLPVAETGQSVTLTLDREIDVSRGDLIARRPTRPGWRTSSRLTSSGCTPTRCCPAART